MMPPIVVVFVVAVGAARREADAGVHEQREELAAFDQRGLRVRLVHLDVEQEPALAQDLGGIDDPGRFFVLGEEARVVGRRAVGTTLKEDKRPRR